MTAGDIIVVNENTFGKKANLYDGVDDYMLVDAHAIARVAANDTVGTYTAWIYVDDATPTSANVILSAGDNSSTDEFLDLFISSTGLLIVKLNHGGTTQFEVRETTASIKARTWTHVAVVQNGTRPILYVNGKPVAMTDTTSTDLTDWYAKLTLADKFAIGVLESNNTHTLDFTGAIGQVKYWDVALSDAEILNESQGTAVQTSSNELNLTMEDDGTTDSGAGADNGTLTGNAHYGGYVSTYSRAMEANVTGHAAEDMNTIDKGNGFYETIIKRGD